MKDQREQTEPSATAACEQPSQPIAPVSFSYIVLLTTFAVGSSSVYHINQQVLPLTARQFTTNMTLIGLIMALPYLTQLFVTPYVAWKSDRIWTRFGRRRPVVMLMVPPVVAALLLAPQCPSLALFIFVIVILQIADDAETAVFMPSVSDSIPDRQRPMAMGVWQMALALSGIILAAYGLPLLAPGVHRLWFLSVNGGNHWPYTITAVLVAITSLIYIGVVRERYVAPRPEDRFHLIKYGKEMFRLREHRLIWGIVFFQPLFFLVPMAFMSTLATQGLGLNTAEYGHAYRTPWYVQMLVGIPLGYLFNRFSHRKALCIAACAYATIPAAYGLFFMRTQQDLAIFLGALVVAFVIFRTNFMPYLMEYTTPKNVGTILGFSKFVDGLVKFTMLPLTGFLIAVSHNNYRIPLYGICVSSVACIIALLMMRPPEKVKHLVEDV